MYRKILFFMFLCNLSVNAQIVNETVISSKTKLGNFYSESFSYPTLMNNELHSNFLLGYAFDENFSLELQGFYDSYLLSDFMKLVLRTRYDLNEKLYFFSGMGIEYESGINSSKDLPRIFLSNGMGYDLNTKVNFEAKHELQINQGSYSGFTTPSLFTLQGKYKF